MKRSCNRTIGELERMDAEMRAGLEPKEFRERFGLAPRDARRLIEARSANVDESDVSAGDSQSE